MAGPPDETSYSPSCCPDLTACNPLKTFWDKTTVSGHVRVRHETDFTRIGRSSRNRQRLRARLGLTYKHSDPFEAGIRFTTGDRKITLDAGDRGGSPLSYQDTGDVFDKFEFNLDRLFITYRPPQVPDLFITAGKFKHPIRLNPIFDSPIGSLVWDEAAQPEGIALGHLLQDAMGFDEIFMTIGESAVLELGNQSDATLFFSQLWCEKQIGQTTTLTASVAFYDWNNLNPNGNTTISTENNAGNSVTQSGVDMTQIGVDNNGNPVIDGSPLYVFDSGFGIINPMMTLTLGTPDDASRYYPVQFVWEAFHNTRSFDPDRDTGTSIGFQYGSAVGKKGRAGGDWKFYYTYSHVEQESVFTPIAQDDFLRTTNFTGHWLGLDIYPRDNVEIRFWLLGDKQIIPFNGTGDEWRGRVDATIYF